MNTNHTTIVLLCTLSLAFHPAMGQKSPDRVSELPSLPAGEQQRVATLKQLASTLSAHYQTHPLAGEAHYDHEHFNPLHWLAYVGDLPKDDLPQKVKDHLAAIDYAQDIPLLIQSGIDVNAATPREITPLMIAASEGQANVVKQLLTCPEIAVNAQTKLGATALMFAAHKDHTDVVRQLLTCPEIAVNAQTKLGATALILAVYKGHAAIVKQLLAHSGIGVNTEAALGTTALMLAAYKRNADIVKQLLACPEIKVNAKAWNGIMALMLAAYKRNANIVKQLLAHPGIKVNARTQQGHTAMDLAIRSRYLPVINLLKDAGSKEWKKLAIEDTKSYAFGSLVCAFLYTVYFDIQFSRLVKSAKLSTHPFLKGANLLREIIYGKNAFNPSREMTWIERSLVYGSLAVVGMLTFCLSQLPEACGSLVELLLGLELSVKEWEYYAQYIGQIDLALY